MAIDTLNTSKTGNFAKNQSTINQVSTLSTTMDGIEKNVDSIDY
jgi:hypothetical protein